MAGKAHCRPPPTAQQTEASAQKEPQMWPENKRSMRGALQVKPQQGRCKMVYQQVISNSIRTKAMRRQGPAMIAPELPWRRPLACPARGQSESRAAAAPHKPPDGKWELKQAPRRNSTGPRGHRDTLQGEGTGSDAKQTSCRWRRHMTPHNRAAGTTSPPGFHTTTAAGPDPPAV